MKIPKEIQERLGFANLKWYELSRSGASDRLFTGYFTDSADLGLIDGAAASVLVSSFYKHKGNDYDSFFDKVGIAGFDRRCDRAVAMEYTLNEVGELDWVVVSVSDEEFRVADFIRNSHVKRIPTSFEYPQSTAGVISRYMTKLAGGDETDHIIGLGFSSLCLDNINIKADTHLQRAGIDIRRKKETYKISVSRSLVRRQPSFKTLNGMEFPVILEKIS